MFKLLIQCIKNFGISGVIIYLKLKLGLTNGLQLPSIKYPIYLHSATDKTTFREIFFRKEYDFNLPKNFNVNIIIDAGANIGLTSVFFANKYPNAKIISIEPDEENFKTLQENVKHYANIHPLQSGVWHKDEFISIADNSYGKRGLMMQRADEGKGIKATSITSLINQFNLSHIDILKMDIEGSEKEVFSENYDWLSQTNCLVIELHDRMKSGCSMAVFKAISKYDFSMSIKGDNLWFVNNQCVS